MQPQHQKASSRGQTADAGSIRQTAGGSSCCCSQRARIRGSSRQQYSCCGRFMRQGMLLPASGCCGRCPSSSISGHAAAHSRTAQDLCGWGIPCPTALPGSNVRGASMAASAPSASRSSCPGVEQVSYTRFRGSMPWAALAVAVFSPAGTL